MQCKRDEASSINGDGMFVLLTKDHKRKAGFDSIFSLLNDVYGKSLVLENLRHKCMMQVNWICTSNRDSENLFVADTSKKLTVYTVL